MISIYQNTGRTFFDVGGIELDYAPADVAVADFDRDGWDDLIVLDSEHRAVRVWLAQQNGEFRETLKQAVGRRPTALAVQDMNADGFPDILVTDRSASDMRIYLNLSGQGLDEENSYGVGENPVFVLSADFTNDRRPDVVVCNAGDGSFTLLRNIYYPVLSQTGTRQLPSRPVRLVPVGERRFVVAYEDSAFLSLMDVSEMGLRETARWPVPEPVVAVAPWSSDGDGAIGLWLVLKDRPVLQGWRFKDASSLEFVREEAVPVAETVLDLTDGTLLASPTRGDSGWVWQFNRWQPVRLPGWWVRSYQNDTGVWAVFESGDLDAALMWLTTEDSLWRWQPVPLPDNLPAGRIEAVLNAGQVLVRPAGGDEWQVQSLAADGRSQPMNGLFADSWLPRLVHVDANRDGEPDWLTVDFIHNRLLLFRQLGKESFAPAEIYQVPEAPIDLVALPREDAAGWFVAVASYETGTLTLFRSGRPPTWTANMRQKKAKSAE
ncbi:MAG: VCBS repeat-containing protein [candidate division KSB1 bacterium]|nr:VCBS repeat-containing protein [candidate division KSB1 bacterium]